MVNHRKKADGDGWPGLSDDQFRELTAGVGRGVASLHGLQNHDYDDFAQLTLTKLYEKYSERLTQIARTGGSLGAYGYRAGFTTGRSELRRQKRQKTLEFNESRDSMPSGPGSPGRFQCLDDEVREQRTFVLQLVTVAHPILKQAKEQLDSAERELLRSMLDRESHSDFATRNGISVDSSRKKRERMLIRLRMEFRLLAKSSDLNSMLVEMGRQDDGGADGEAPAPPETWLENALNEVLKYLLDPGPGQQDSDDIDGESDDDREDLVA